MNRDPNLIFSVLAERDVFLVDLEWSAASRDSGVAQEVILDSDQCEKFTTLNKNNNIKQVTIRSEWHSVLVKQLLIQYYKCRNILVLCM